MDHVADWNANLALLHDTYRPEDEHDACGVGLVASLDGRARRDVVQAGIDALRAVWHRGAVDADGKTGDGAGIHIEIPQDFFADVIKSGGGAVRPDSRIAVGQVFLPKTDLAAQERCRRSSRWTFRRSRIAGTLPAAVSPRSTVAARRPSVAPKSVEVAGGVVEDLAEQGGDLIFFEITCVNEAGEGRRPSPS